MTTTCRDLERSIAFRLADPPADGDGLTLSGYAAVFSQPTRIDSWEGTFNEDIRAGAFKKTIRERGVVLQFEHGRHPLIGSLPIGRIDTLREDDQGLYVEARLTDNWVTQPVRDAISDGAIDGMSFRFEVVREEWRDAKGVKLTDPAEIQRLLWEPGDRGPLQRTLVEVRLFELGPVVFPAYDGTSVGVRMAEAVRSADPGVVRAIRGSLVADLPVEVDLDIARALLVPPDDSPEQGEPRTDAPLEGHPAPAAPPTQEHPSPPPIIADRHAQRRRTYLMLNGVGKRYAS